MSKEHIQGSENASIELIEYGDYQCPYCKDAYIMVKKAQEELGNDLKFIFRNFPLEDIHQHAMNAALAAECASAQDKFWDMHDILFENQDYLDDSYLLQYAKIIGLNLHNFEHDFGKDEFYRKIENDMRKGEDMGVEGTPTFFINGELYEGNLYTPQFIENLKAML